MTDVHTGRGEAGGLPEPIGASRVLRDIRNQPGVDSVEGKLVPLLSGAGIRAQLIDMPGGLYVHAHPHPTESLIYTVSGRWVFSDGIDRKIVETGDLLHFPPNEPTGFEVPFDEPAVIYITKGDGGKTHDELMTDLRKASANMAKEAEDGEVFSLAELPHDHPARAFARQLGFKGAN
jgi:quercetin dioxygenase-like cupin family protein